MVVAAAEVTAVAVVPVVLVAVVPVLKAVIYLELLELDTPEEVVVVDHPATDLLAHRVVAMVLLLSDILYNGIV